MHARGRQFVHQQVVELLDQIVTSLVEPVDRAFYPRDARVGYIRASGDVFLMPKRKVLLVLKADDPEESLVSVVDLGFVPSSDGRRVQVEDALDVDHGFASVQCQGTP